MSDQAKIIEVMAEAVRVSRINDVYDADEIASDILAALSAEGMAVVPVAPTPSPSATELALAEAVGHIALLTAFWMETPDWSRAAEAAREFIGGVPIDWKADRPEASAEARRAVANTNYGGLET